MSGTQGKLGFLSADLLTLADLKSLTNANNNSINNTPNHISAINLHAQGTGLYQKGINLAGITTDIDGELRSVSTPCIGADEFLPPAKELKVLSILYPTANALCGIATDSIVLAIQNLGTATQTSFTMGAIIKGAITTSVSNTFTGSLLPNQIDTITINRTGDIKIGSGCNPDLVLGNISNLNFKFQLIPVRCRYDTCSCFADIATTKIKNYDLPMIFK